MDESPASPSPNVSDDSDDMDTDMEEDLLAYHGMSRDSSSDPSRSTSASTSTGQYTFERCFMMAGPVDRCIRTVSEQLKC